MKVLLREYNVNVGQRNRRVLVPQVEWSGVFVIDCQNSNDFMIFGNQDVLINLAATIEYLSRHKAAMIYIQSKKQGLPNWAAEEPTLHSALDIVLIHHSLQFKTNQWKQVRASLQETTMNTSTCFESYKLETEVSKEIEETWYTYKKEAIDVKRAYDSLFIVGSAKSFRRFAFDCLDAANAQSNQFHNHIDWYMRHQGKGDHPELLVQHWEEDN